MNRELWEALSKHSALTDEELDERRKEMIGEGLDELDDEWFNLLEFTYNIDQYDEIVGVTELGAATTIAIIHISKSDLDYTYYEDKDNFERMQRQTNYIGEIARFIHYDESLMFDSVDEAREDDRVLGIAVWT